MMFKRMTMRCHGSSIYFTLSIVLFTGCQSNVNLPKQPPDKVVEKEQVIRTYTAQTVNNKSDTQQDTATKVIAREREQVDDRVPMPLQDNRSQTQKNTATKVIAREREQVDDTSHTDLQEDIDTSESVSEKEIERTLTISMLNNTQTDSAYSSDDEGIEQECTALNVSTEEEQDILDQLKEDFVRDIRDINAAIGEVPGSTQE